VSLASAEHSVASELADAIRAAAVSSANETELSMAVEKALAPVLAALGIPSHPEYERSFIEGRADAVYGWLIIEYERPGKLATVKGRNEAFGQCRHYMAQRAEEVSPGEREKALPKLVGVALDGDQIGFVRWRAVGQEDDTLPDLSRHRAQLTIETEAGLVGGFEEHGPFEVTADSITDFLLYLRALSRRPLEAKALADEFGPDGDTAGEVVNALYSALLKSESAHTAMLYGEWLRLFGAIYGEPSKGKTAGTKALAKAYGLSGSELGRMLFAVHTYFALVMKILAVELVALQKGAVLDPLVSGLSALPDGQFKRRFKNLESGQEFRAHGVENFLEGDFLGWYVHEWSPELVTALRGLARRLQDYEPATATLRPDLTQDLLKGLYHRLLPRELRHDLGEYYTPDWLAEYTTERAGFRGQLGKRVLDPACGSGTFLVAAIKRIKATALAEGLPAEDTARAIARSVVGFDLNPLAVIAARTNFLLAAGDLIRAIAPFHIPVYICDSITTPSVQDGVTSLEGVKLATTVADFVVPHRFTSYENLSEFVAAIEFCLENGFSPEEFVGRLRQRWDDLSGDETTVARELYSTIEELKAAD
jgi:SAM-dependent methyltransferase